MSQNTVRTWMTPAPITLCLQDTVIAAYEKMKLHHVRRLPVMNREKLVGIITINDVRSIISLDTEPVIEHNNMLIHKTVVNAMTPNPITIEAEENVGEAARLMMKHKVSGLPVMENDKLVGIISEADLFRLIIAENWYPQTINEPNRNDNEIITLSNRESIHIRSIRPDDALRLQASLVKMSPETIYDRFMGYKKTLDDQEARYLTNLDYDHHMALVATTIKEGEENIVGVARYHILDGEVDVAEFAIVISDLYQRHGLGTHLMKRLMEYAQAHGIDTFMGFAHEGNTRLLRFVQRSGLPIESKFKDGMWELQIHLKGIPFARLTAKRDK